MSRQGPEPSEEQLSRLAVVGQPGPREVDRPTEDVLARGLTRSTGVTGDGL